MKLGLTVLHIFDEYQPVSNKTEIEYCIEYILYRRHNSLNVFFSDSNLIRITIFIHTYVDMSREHGVHVKSYIDNN